jgi:hypothetical protein
VGVWNTLSLATEEERSLTAEAEASSCARALPATDMGCVVECREEGVVCEEEGRGIGCGEEIGMAGEAAEAVEEVELRCGVR